LTRRRRQLKPTLWSEEPGGEDAAGVGVAEPSGRETARPAHGVIIYHSGMSSITDFRGAAMAGVPVGLQIMDASEAVRAEAVAYADGGGLVFNDTGAFPAFRRNEEVDFAEVFRRFRAMLAAATRPAGLAFVMPDRVGDQSGTLRLLEEYRDEVAHFVAAGCDVMVAVQRGELSLAEAYRETCRVLGTDEFRVAMPSNEAAVTEGELLAFLDEVRPRRLHLLGIARNRRFAPLVAEIRRRSPETHVSSDANRLRAMLGKGRPVTEAVNRRVRERIDEVLEEDHLAGVGDVTEIVYHIWNTPAFLKESEARRLARHLTQGWTGERGSEEFFKRIVAAARDPHPPVYDYEEDASEGAFHYGSSLGQLIEEFFPGQLGDWDIETFIQREIRRTVQPDIRAEEIARHLRPGSRPGETPAHPAEVIAPARLTPPAPLALAEAARAGFDIVVGNPPFGLKLAAREMAGRYHLTPRGRNRAASVSELYFVELMLRSLAPGGHFAAIVPDGLLANSSMGYARDYFRHLARLRSVTSLHKTVFCPYVVVKTSILHLERWERDAADEDYMVMMSISERSNRDAKGRPVMTGDLDDTAAAVCLSLRGEESREKLNAARIEEGERRARYEQALRAEAQAASIFKAAWRVREKTGLTVWEIFRAFLGAVELAAGCETEEGLAQALRVAGDEHREELRREAEALCEFVARERRELLGHAFMTCGSNDGYFGQFFTHADEARALAEIVTCLGGRTPTPDRPLRVYDPAAGAGALLIGVANALPREWVEGGLVHFYGGETHPTVAQMARINMRLFGLRGEVVCGDSLRDAVWLDEGAAGEERLAA
jgi:hypothetical protein